MSRLSSGYKLGCLLIDNSVGLTGAFRSGLEIDVALGERVRVEWVLPSSASQQIISALDERGHERHLVNFVEIGKSLDKLLMYFPTLFYNTIVLFGLVRRRNISLIIVNDYYNILGASLKFFGWRGRLITFIRLLPSGQQPLMSALWEWIAFRYSDEIIAVSHAVSNEVPALRAKVIYDPIPEYTKGFLKPIRRSHGAVVRFLYLAHYVRGKGHMDAIASFARLRATGVPCELHMYGDHMDLIKNVRLKEDLSLAAHSMGISSSVHICGPIIDVEEEILSCDVLLNFSESESFSRTCLEAGALGRPVISTRCGGPEEIIEDGVTGLLVPIGDVQQMYIAMRKLSLDRDLRLAMGISAFRLVREKFSRKLFEGKLVSLVEGL